VSATTIHPTTDRHSLLRRGLLADGLFSGTTAMIMILAATPLSELFDLPVMLLRIVGVSLIPFSATLFYLASRVETHLPLVWGIVGSNLAWVVASGIFLVSGWVDPTSLGVAFVIGQALMVAVFAEFQFFGLRRSG
jgi:hypothetical protein